MSKSKYVDTAAIMQVIGAIYIQPSLLDNENYHFHEEDFCEDFHVTLFGTIYNLHALGAKEITLNAIEDYLAQRPKRQAIYKANKGAEYLEQLKEATQLSAFQYYYDRVKKMTLLRMYNERCGMDLSWLYDMDNIFDAKKKQAQEDWLDNTPLVEIADLIDKKIDEVKSVYVDNCEADIVQAGAGVELLLEQLKQKPELGYPLYGKYINTIFRGARLKKFYLRSAATGVGKTRSMVADACYIGCGSMYSLEERTWINTGEPQATLYIATEQELSEVQTMMISFLSGVNEEHIVTGEYLEGEWERALHAAQLLKTGKIYFEALPDFSLQDIENVIKKGIRENDIKYVFHDYIHTSMKILEEITRRSGGVRLREDNILFMISVRLKDLCNQYGIFIMSATQLSNDYHEAEVYDQGLLRGAKSIADKIDAGSILLEATDKDKEALAPLVKRLGCEMPDIKMSIYKNRRGRWKNVLVWIKSDRGICRLDPIFVTKYSYELVDIEDFKINVKKSVDLSAF